MGELLKPGQDYAFHLGDNVELMHKMPSQSCDFSIWSPAFPAVYAYTSEACDIGNSEDEQESKLHLSFFFKQFARVMRPGRVVIIHVQQIVRMKRAGEQGLRDFRGLIINLAQRAGLIYEFDWLVTKNPQAQAIRNKAWELKFQGFESDRARCRGALGDYLIKFVAPGENSVKVNSKGDLGRNDWIGLAEGAWTDINEQDTLSVKEARGEDDAKHLCALQLEVYRRCILLFTNPGEIVFEPFGGVASGGFSALGGISPKTKKAIGNPRRYVAHELKQEYWETGLRNLDRAQEQHKAAQQKPLFGDDVTEVVSLDPAEVA